MNPLLFTKQEWDEVLKTLGKAYRVFVPVQDGDFHSFQVLEQGTQPDFDFQNTRLSPKSHIYPQSERMFECTIDPEDPEAHVLKEASKDYAPQVVVGIRPCDVHAFQIVQRNFDNPEYRDPWWVQRFESTMFVGLGCHAPCSTCFCTSVGGGPFNQQGLDVLLYDLGDRFLAKPITEKGQNLLDEIQSGTPASKSDIKEADDLKTGAENQMTSAVSVDHLYEKKVNDLFNAPFWEEVAFACINCGTCTYLCPTCWCFDIQDEVFAKQVDRIRNWDSCMFPLFTLEGSGHNPRPQKFQRVRQRFMHKLKYYVDKYQQGVQCSGCGRCVRYCPVNIDIRQVAERMNQA